MKRLLIADDDAGMRAALEARFRRGGWMVDVAADGAEALAKFREGLHPLLITDVRMPGRDGFELMRAARESAPPPAVILLTAYACVPDAVEAMRGGACDYLVKPVSFEKLELTVERVLRRAGELNGSAPRHSHFPRPQNENGNEHENEHEENKNEGDGRLAGRARAGGEVEPAELIGSSPAWERALRRARQAAATDADILIEAESGTGKELVARLIHRLSRRRQGPFVALNCAAFPEALLESELFGHASGAFTGAVGARAGKFEAANGGTLLLDEAGEMPLALQPKLLRALQEREFDRLGSNRTVRVDIRVIATTNRPLEAAVAEGRFRADLFYRLNVIPIALPPLRERPGDIAALAEHFVRLYSGGGANPSAGCGAARGDTTETAASTGNLAAPPRLSPELLARLAGRAWPGNVRELANFVRRAVALSLPLPGSGEIGVEALEYGLEHGRKHDEHGRVPFPPGASPAAPSPPTAWKPGLSLGEMERQLFAMTLEATGGNRARAAELLGVSLRTVRNKVRQFGLPPRAALGRQAQSETLRAFGPGSQPCP